MNVASRITVPDDRVFCNLSEPARSTRCIFDRCNVAEDDDDVSLFLKLTVSMFNVNTACDLEDRSFIACDPIALCASPSNHNANASSSEHTSFVVKPLTKTPESGPSRKSHTPARGLDSHVNSANQSSFRYIFQRNHQVFAVGFCFSSSITSLPPPSHDGLSFSTSLPAVAPFSHR